MSLWNLTYKIKLKLTYFKKLDKKYLFVDVQQLSNCNVRCRFDLFLFWKKRAKIQMFVYPVPIFLDNESVYYLSNNAWWNYSKAEFTCLIYGSISIYESLTDPYKYLLMDSISMTLFFENFLSTSSVITHNITFNIFKKSCHGNGIHK